MVEVELKDKEFDQLLNYCITNKNAGRYKYFWEIEVEDYAYKRFCAWLEKCEDAFLGYVFVAIRRREGLRVLYGFSNFEVLEDEAVTCYEFSFTSDEILKNRFRMWRKECEFFMLPFSLLGFFKVMDAIADNYAEIKPLFADEEN